MVTISSRAGAEQFDAGLITDFDAPAGEQGHAPAQIRQLGALAEIQFRARRAKLVVKMVDGRIILLADIAILRFDHLAKIRVPRDFLLHEAGRGENIGRGEHFFAPQLPDSRLRQHRLGALHPVGLALARRGLHQPPPLAHIRTINIAGRLEQALAVLERQGRQQRAVARNRFQQLRRRPQLFGRHGAIALPVGGRPGRSGTNRFWFVR